MYFSRVPTALVLLLLLASGARSDSFMTSTQFASGVGDVTLPKSQDTPLGARQMLFIMQWRGTDPAKHDLGGISSPADATDAIEWLSMDESMSYERRFLAAYKASRSISTAEDARPLIAEMHTQKARASQEGSSTIQAVMALGIAIVELQNEAFSLDGGNTWKLQSGPKFSAAGGFAEAVVITKLLETSRPQDAKALRHALNSAWDYAMLYEGVASVFRMTLSLRSRAWIESPES